MTASNAPAALLQAYQSALYEVDIDGAIAVIRIGRALPRAIDEQLEAQGVSSAAFLSAANPRSELLADEDNAQRHSKLLQALAALGVQCLSGRGRDASGQWPSEQSVLGFGLAHRQAMGLAEQFDQNAYVAVRRGEAARLVLTSHWPADD